MGDKGGRPPTRRAIATTPGGIHCDKCGRQMYWERGLDMEERGLWCLDCYIEMWLFMGKTIIKESRWFRREYHKFMEKKVKQIKGG